MKLSLLFALFSISCGYPTNYTVGVSGEFSDARTEVIVDAVDKWQSAVGNHLKTYIGCYQPTDADICIVPQTNAQMIARGCSASNGPAFGCSYREFPVNPIDPVGPTVRINSDLTSKLGLLSHVAQHELGHAFGLRHSNDRVVMFPSSDNVEVQAEASQDVTCEDAIDFWKLR